MDPANSAPLGIALFGLLLGMRHATDADHVIAVTTILGHERRVITATRIGVVWGLGHSVTVLAVGAAIIIFKIAIPERFGFAMELAVALMLILLGLGSFGTILRRLCSYLFGIPPHDPGEIIVHSHFHARGSTRHRRSHAHRHALVPSSDEPQHDQGPESHLVHTLGLDEMQASSPAEPLLRSFVVGLIHGLAGSAAMALLVLSAISEPLWATLYLAIFCVGTIIGMALITTTIATPMVLASRRLSLLHHRLVAASGLLSFGFGLLLVYRMGALGRILEAAAAWRQP